MFCISFFNKRHVQFDENDFSILKNEWINNKKLKSIFHVLDGNELEEFVNVVKRQMMLYIGNYKEPEPVTNIRFDRRTLIEVNGFVMQLDIKKNDHFKIYVLHDIFSNSVLSLDRLESVYMMPRENLINENHLPIIYRIKYLLENKIFRLRKIEKCIVDEFGSDVSEYFIYEILKDLENNKIISVDVSHDLVEKSKYFYFFY